MILDIAVCSVWTVGAMERIMGEGGMDQAY